MYYESLNQIEMLIERGKFSLAQEKITEGLALFPDAAELHALQAWVYLETKQLTDATETIGLAISYNPEDSYLFYLQTRILIQADQDQEALQSINRAIDMDPEVAGYYVVKASILLSKKQYDPAIGYAEKALDLDPENLDAQNMLALAQTQKGNTDFAHQTLIQALEKDPENALTQANAGYHYLRMQDIKKAKEHFAAALSMDPELDFAREGMILAIKSSNVIYAKLLQFSFWVEQKSTRNRWLFIIGLIVVVKVLPFLLPFYLLFLLWTWFSDPISDIILYFDQYGKHLMSPYHLRVTQINVGLAFAVLPSLVLGFVLDGSFFLLAFGLFSTLIPVHRFDLKTKLYKKIILGLFTLLFLGSGVVAVVRSVGMGLDYAGAVGALFLGVFVFSWVASFLD